MSNPRSVRLLGIIKYLAVPNSLVSCEYLICPLCHGRGREFESRRPRQLHSVAHLAVMVGEPGEPVSLPWGTKLDSNNSIYYF